MTWNFTCGSLTRRDGEGWEELSLPLKPQSTCFGSPMEDEENAHDGRLSWRKWSPLNLYYDLESKNAARNPAAIGHRKADFPAASGVTDRNLRKHCTLISPSGNTG